MNYNDRRPTDYAAAMSRGVNTSAVRHANQRALLLQVAVQPGLSNAELSRRSGLAPQSVSAVLEDLDTAGLIVRGPLLRGRRGQPATPVFLNPAGAFAFGIEVGWSRLDIVLIGLTGDVRGRYRRDYSYPDGATIFEELAEQVALLAAGLSEAERARLVGIGLAAPGGIGDASSLIETPTGQAEAWAGVDMVDRVEALTGLSVELYNDGDAACWQEFSAHPPPRPQTFSFLLIDTFVGAGIVVGSRMWEGVRGASANLGSMLVSDRRGQARFVHELASLFALRRRLEVTGLSAEEALAAPPGSEGARQVEDWIADASYALAQAILNTATVIDHEVAILDADLPRPVLERLVKATAEQVDGLPSLGRRSPPVVAGHVGGAGAALGAAKYLQFRRFFARDLEHMAF